MLSAKPNPFGKRQHRVQAYSLPSCGSVTVCDTKTNGSSVGNSFVGSQRHTNFAPYKGTQFAGLFTCYTHAKNKNHNPAGVKGSESLGGSEYSRE